ncbi:MAG: Uma2 family endonuclease [Cyanobacteria bacterium J06634_6]
MTYTVKRYTSYQDYLDAEDLSPEGNYRLLSTGEVIEVPLENDINARIISALFAALIKANGFSFAQYIRPGNKEIQVQPIGDQCVNRKPDLIVLRPEHLEQARQAITLGLSAPLFIAEVVSPGGESSENYLRDYAWKRQQYEDWQIPEYWIIEPHRGQVMVLALKSGTYQESLYTGERAITSTTFPNIQITAHDLIAGHIEDD